MNWINNDIEKVNELAKRYYTDEKSNKILSAIVDSDSYYISTDEFANDIMNYDFRTPMELIEMLKAINNTSFDECYEKMSRVMVAVAFKMKDSMNSEEAYNDKVNTEEVKSDDSISPFIYNF